ncbi:MAG: hypothetical protein AB7K09_04120 [Planctomycetota bacterium]
MSNPEHQFTPAHVRFLLVATTARLRLRAGTEKGAVAYDDAEDLITRLEELTGHRGGTAPVASLARILAAVRAMATDDWTLDSWVVDEVVAPLVAVFADQFGVNIDDVDDAASYREDAGTDDDDDDTDDTDDDDDDGNADDASRRRRPATHTGTSYGLDRNRSQRPGGGTASADLRRRPEPRRVCG